MKALSILQPWATLIACGAKRIETRSWPTSHRGELAIHASLALDPDQLRLCETEPFLEALFAAGYEHPRDLPRGAVVATARVQDCRRVEDVMPSSTEQAFGDFTAGRWAWVLADVVRLRRPAPARGALGLWTWTGAGDAPGQLSLLDSKGGDR